MCMKLMFLNAEECNILALIKLLGEGEEKVLVAEDKYWLLCIAE